MVSVHEFATCMYILKNLTCIAFSKKVTRYHEMNLRPSSASGLLYDAVWAMVLTLQNVSDRVKMNDSSCCDHFFR